MAATGADMVEPKKPPNAYWMWMGDNREKICAELGGTKKGPAVSKVAGDRWRVMSEADKAPYVKKAETQRLEYQKALQEFTMSGGQKAKRGEKRRKEEDPNVSKRARKLERKETARAIGKPTRPVNAYWLWLNDNRAQIQKDAGTNKIGKVGKLAGERWKNLSAAEKAPYENKAEERKKAYRAEFDKWKESKGGSQADDAGGDEDDGAEGEGAEGEEAEE